jgi:hypothetical protein
VATFPNAIFSASSPATKRDSVFTLQELLDIIDESEATETALGINPGTSTARGTSYGSVDARLEAIETQLGALGKAALVNLRITNNPTTPTTKLDVSWDALSVQGESFSVRSFTIDSGTTGVNGKDVSGALVANTPYYPYAIVNVTTGSADGLLSANASAPSLPSGYSKYRRIGAVITNASAQFLRYFQQDQLVIYNGDDSSTSLRLTVPSLGRSTSFANVFCVNAIPPTSRLGIFHVILSGLNGTGSAYLLRGGVTAGAGQAGLLALFNIASGVEARNSGIPMGVDGTGAVQYKFAGTSTSGGVFLEVQGYYDSV